MKKRLSSTVPYVEAAHQGRKQKPTAIRISISFTSSDKGAALGRALYWHRKGAMLKPAHYVVDSATTYQCVPDNVRSVEKNLVEVEVCTEPYDDIPGLEGSNCYAAWMRGAELVGKLCIEHKINPRYLTEKQETKWHKRRRRSRGGLIVGVQGNWPYAEFLARVREVAMVPSLGAR